MSKGLFIVFEGGEGSGKSSQAARLSKTFENLGIATYLTREPGDTTLGADLRKILLDSNREPISRKAEALLFAADRAEHVEKVIAPALARGGVVICDRYIASTMAYQAYAGDLEEDKVEFVSRWASEGVLPDVTYFLDVPPAIGLERAKRVARTRFEDKTVEYHERVREGFLRQSTTSWFHINAEQSMDKVEQCVFDHAIKLYVKTMMGKLRASWTEANPPMFDPKNSPICLKCNRPLKLDAQQMGDGRLLYRCDNGCESRLMPSLTLVPGYLKWPEPSDKLIAFAERAASGKVEFARGENVYDVLGDSGWTLMKSGLLELRLPPAEPSIITMDKWTLTADGTRWLEKATNSWVEVDGDLEQYGTKEDTTRCPDCSSWLVQDPGMSMSWNCPNGHGCMEVSLQGGKWYPSSGKPQRCPTCADVLIVMSNSCLSGHGFYADNGNWVPLATGSRSVNVVNNETSCGRDRCVEHKVAPEVVPLDGSLLASTSIDLRK